MSAGNLESGVIHQPAVDLSRFRQIESNSEAANELAAQLSEYVVGQEHATHIVAREIMRSQGGLNDPTKPRSTLLFAGLTGVGKTEMSEAIARVLYGDEWESHYKRIDCTQLQEKSTLSRITGASPTYVGYGDAPLITPDFLNQQGGTVITFDEIEKADPSIWRALLSVTDKATLLAYIKKENEGNNTHAEPVNLQFNDSIIIFTSNAGATEMQSTRSSRRIGFQGGEPVPQQDIEGAARSGLKSAFRSMPEFLGRIGENRMIVFNELDMEDYSRIFDYMLRDVNNRITNQLYVGDRLRARILATAVGDGSYGARDLKHTIDQLVVSPVGELRYTNAIAHNTEILIEDGDDGLIFLQGDVVVKEPINPQPVSVDIQLEPGTIVDIPPPKTKTKEVPVVERPKVTFEYGEPFSVLSGDLSDQVMDQDTQLELVSGEKVRGFIDIFEANQGEHNKVPTVYLSDILPYGIRIQLVDLTEQELFTHKVQLFCGDQSFTGRQLPKKPEDNNFEVIVSAWEDKNRKPKEESIRLLFSREDLKRIRIQIDK